MMFQRLLSGAVLVSSFFVFVGCASSSKDTGVNLSADEMKSGGLVFSKKEDIHSDFAKACEISKEASRMEKSAKFKKDKVALVAHINDRIENELKTHTVKHLHAVITQSDAKERAKTWHKAAKENGLENWSCPTISSL